MCWSTAPTSRPISKNATRRNRLKKKMTNKIVGYCEMWNSKKIATKVQKFDKVRLKCCFFVQNLDFVLGHQGGFNQSQHRGGQHYCQSYSRSHHERFARTVSYVWFWPPQRLKTKCLIIFWINLASKSFFPEIFNLLKFPRRLWHCAPPWVDSKAWTKFVSQVCEFKTPQTKIIFKTYN